MLCMHSKSCVRILVLFKWLLIALSLYRITRQFPCVAILAFPSNNQNGEESASEYLDPVPVLGKAACQNGNVAVADYMEPVSTLGKLETRDDINEKAESNWTLEEEQKDTVQN